MAKFDERDGLQAEWLGATPSDIAELLMDAGLVDAVVAGLDGEPAITLRRAEGRGWRSDTDQTRAAIACHLAEADRTTEAKTQAKHIRSGTLRLGVQARMAVAFCYDPSTGTATPERVVAARREVEKTLREAVALERASMQADARRRIDERLTDATRRRSVNDRDDVYEEMDKALEAFRDFEQRDQQLNKLMRISLRADITVRLARAVRDLARQDRAAATVQVQQFVDDALAERQRAQILISKFEAASATLEALYLCGDEKHVQQLADAIMRRLNDMPGPMTMRYCLEHALTAFAEVGALSEGVVSEIEALVDSVLADGSNSAVQFALLAAKVSAAGPPRLAKLAVEWSLLDLRNEALGYYHSHWYGPALHVLKKLVDAGHAEPAATLAQALLQYATSKAVLWWDKAAVLGGLVNAAENTTRDKSLQLLTLEAGFPDHVQARAGIEWRRDAAFSCARVWMLRR